MSSFVEHTAAISVPRTDVVGNDFPLLHCRGLADLSNYALPPRTLWPAGPTRGGPLAWQHAESA
eukprot:8208759-Alexandrium_andersonii.AAC.1